MLRNLTDRFPTIRDKCRSRYGSDSHEWSLDGDHIYR